MNSHVQTDTHNTHNCYPGWADHPFWYTRSFQRINHAAVMTHELLQWVKTTHPYWNRTAGADHIWHFSHDEGACWAPSEIYNRSIILTHWGRMDAEHESGTSFGPVSQQVTPLVTLAMGRACSPRQRLLLPAPHAQTLTKSTQKNA